MWNAFKHIDYIEDQGYQKDDRELNHWPDYPDIDGGDTVRRDARQEALLDYAFRGLEERKNSVSEIRSRCESFLKFDLGSLVALLGIQSYLTTGGGWQKYLFLVAALPLVCAIFILLSCLKTHKFSGLPEVKNIRQNFLAAPEYRENVSRSLHLVVSGIRAVQDQLAQRLNWAINCLAASGVFIFCLLTYQLFKN